MPGACVSYVVRVWLRGLRTVARRDGGDQVFKYPTRIRPFALFGVCFL